MKVKITNRGFEYIEQYNEKIYAIRKLVSQSSSIHTSPFGPGSSFLWFGNEFHLEREEVKELIKHLQAWVDTGSLIIKHKEFK